MPFRGIKTYVSKMEHIRSLFRSVKHYLQFFRVKSLNIRALQRQLLDFFNRVNFQSPRCVFDSKDTFVLQR